MGENEWCQVSTAKEKPIVDEDVNQCLHGLFHEIHPNNCWIRSREREDDHQAIGKKAMASLPRIDKSSALKSGMLGFSP